MGPLTADSLSANFPEPEPGEQRWEIFGERMSAREVEHVFGTPKARFLRRIDQGIEPEKAALNERIYGHKVSRHKVRSGHRIFRLRKAMGFNSPDDLAAKAGIRSDRVLDYEYGMSPWSDKRCDWKNCAKRLAEGLGVFPEEIWPRVARIKLPRMVQADEYSDPEAFGMDETVDARRMVLAINEALNRMEPKERWIIGERFGFDGEAQTLKEIGNKIARSQERIRQHESKALRKFRTILYRIYAPGRRRWPIGEEPGYILHDYARIQRIPGYMQLRIVHDE